MKLETAGSLKFDEVTEQQLRDAFAYDKLRGEYVILNKSSGTFMQAAGEGDGPYVLEHRDSDAGEHLSAGADFRKAEVLRAFVWYLGGDDRWRSEFSWQKFERKPWWKLW